DNLTTPGRKIPRALLAVAALAGLAALAALLLPGSPRSAGPAAFDLQALGAKQHILPTVNSPAFTATIGARGYTTGVGAHAVSVAAVGAGAGGWRLHAHGVTRSTSYGHETTTLAANTAAQLSTVDRHR